MNPIDLETARRLIDFSGGDDSLKSLAEMQIKGAVALQNMIVDPEIGPPDYDDYGSSLMVVAVLFRFSWSKKQKRFLSNSSTPWMKRFSCMATCIMTTS